MTTLFLLFTLITTTYAALVLSDFRRDALAEHNRLRQLHCTAPLVLNDTLNSIAQNYSQYLAANNLFRHSGYPRLGENLYYAWSSARLNPPNGKRCI